MPQHVIDLLDHLMENGTDPDIKILGEGIKCALNMLSDIDEKVDVNFFAIQDHVKDDNIHTPKGLLVRGKVLAWFATGALILFTGFYIIATAIGIEELLKALIP